MIVVDEALKERERSGELIRVGLVGAGFAGKGFALQLLGRLPGLRLAIPLEEVRFRHDMSAYGVHELPVLW